MELLVCVINDEEKLDDILSGLLELGVTGATVLNSRGMARHIPEAPVFAGLKDVMAGARPQNATIFSVIESREQLEAAIEMIKNVCGDLTAPGTGILFTLSLNQVIGIEIHPVKVELLHRFDLAGDQLFDTRRVLGIHHAGQVDIEVCRNPENWHPLRNPEFYAGSYVVNNSGIGHGKSPF